MNDVPRQTLRDLIARHGPGLCSDARRCEGLLRDLCGAHRREINILVSALKERVPLDLLAAQNSMPRGLLLSRLSRRLEDQLALTDEAARWAVGSWALALGVVTDAELKERESQREKTTAPPPATPPARPVPGEDARETSDEQTHAPRPGATTSRQPPGSQQRPHSPQPSPRQAPPPPSAPRHTSRRQPTPPPPMHPPAPTGRAPFNNRATRAGPYSNAPAPTGMAPAPPTQPASPDPFPARRRRGRTLRGCSVGCLLVVLLALALFVGGPFVVSVLREEQQRRVNEQPPAMSQ